MLLIKGAHVVDPQVGLDTVTDVLVEGARIARVGANIKTPEGAEVIDGTGKYLVPGLTDIHVHFRDPGYEYKETIETGSAAAAAGGFTDVATMPNTNPVTDTGEGVRYQIAKGDAAKAAEAAGAQEVGDDDLIAKIAGGYLDFDVLVTTPDMMGRVGRLGKVLGPRGLMPNPKAGTVTPDVGKAVTDAKAGKIEYRLDKQNIIHVPIGKASFGAEKLMTNLDTVLDAIAKAKPAAAKGQYFKSATVATTMGPGVRVATNKYGV